MTDAASFSAPAANVAQLPVPPVVKSVTVPIPPPAAVERFTAEIHRWWPVATHSMFGAQSAHVGFEARVGGRLFERRRDGEETTWGSVAAWEPPARVAFSWHVGRGPEGAQRVEVTFAPEPGGTGTVVTLVHSGWESLGERAVPMRDEYDNGWQLVFLTCFARHAGAARS
jgi:uncharacterized protein YndB with AHSA1/START domain